MTKIDRIDARLLCRFGEEIKLREACVPEGVTERLRELLSYPTIIVLDPSGKPMGQLGYEEDGTKFWFSELEKITLSVSTPEP